MAGTSNPDLEATITAQAVSTNQILGFRRFVSRPLAAHTFAVADGNWTFSWAAFESNANHVTSNSQGTQCVVYFWRPTTGARVGSAQVNLNIFAALSTTETAFSITSALSSGPVSILDGDIVVFDVFTNFTQGMSSAYTESFSYNGTTEASITTCASFVTPPAALTLFTAAATTSVTQVPVHLPFMPN